MSSPGLAPTPAVSESPKQTTDLPGVSRLRTSCCRGGAGSRPPGSGRGRSRRRAAGSPGDARRRPIVRTVGCAGPWLDRTPGWFVRSHLPPVRFSDLGIPVVERGILPCRAPALTSPDPIRRITAIMGENPAPLRSPRSRSTPSWRTCRGASASGCASSVLRHGGSRAFEDAHLFAEVERLLFTRERRRRPGRADPADVPRRPGDLAPRHRHPVQVAPRRHRGACAAVREAAAADAGAPLAVRVQPRQLRAAAARQPRAASRASRNWPSRQSRLRSDVRRLSDSPAADARKAGTPGGR